MFPVVVRVELVVIAPLVLMTAAPPINVVPARVPELMVGAVIVLFSRVSVAVLVTIVPVVG
jgi:hypothetical protein